ncbi:hypothetical protein IMCC9480_2438 [Oxalobacteraceae bacterium IMCC9480]|nr:hypothetical protein IMCC9480_2438 [Oxalobacteraceae bacterium IMCC9480]
MQCVGNVYVFFQDGRCQATDIFFGNNSINELALAGCYFFHR